MKPAEETSMMKCGHAANAISNGKPVCAICIGLTPDAEIIAEMPNLVGRKSRCAYYRGCKSEVDSNTNIAFFEHLPDKEHDRYYCGCHGWN